MRKLCIVRSSRVRGQVCSREAIQLQAFNNLGLPELRSFVKFLRAGRAREEVVKWVAKEFRCDECETKVVPKAPRPAVVPKCYKPSIAVGLDLFYIQNHARQRSIPVLNVVRGHGHQLSDG